jgi:inhibitor of KinA sporulation pathway (predicted exonuclease)
MRKIEIINVVDVEATCWLGDPPPGQVSEIIEVGLAELDPHKLEIVGARSVLCLPVDSEIGPFCTDLTTLTDEKVRAEGIEFGGVSTLLRNFHASRERIWASFGDYDRTAFERNCVRRNVPYPFGPRHINVKTLVALAFGWRHEFGMAEVLNRIGLPLIGTHHRGGDDALNIAKILIEVLRTARGRI